MSEPKIICCPKCGNEVIHYDGRATINPAADCRKCKKRIIYHIDSGKAEITSIPARTSSSGIRFY